MGASAREIERQIKETRERMDNNLNQLEDRAASNAVRYGRIAAIVVGVVAIGGAGFLLYRRMHRPTLKDRLDDLSIENLRELAEAVSGRLKGQLPSVTVKVNEPTPQEPGTIESIVRRVAPAMLGTVSTALLERVSRRSDETVAPQAKRKVQDAWSGDIRVQIPQANISIGELQRYLHRWLGQDVEISGNVVQSAKGIALTVRGTNVPGKTFEGKLDDLPKLLTSAAEYVYGQSEPFLFEVYLTDVGRDAEAIVAIF